MMFASKCEIKFIAFKAFIVLTYNKQYYIIVTTLMKSSVPQ